MDYSLCLMAQPLRGLETLWESTSICSYLVTTRKQTAMGESLNFSKPQFPHL